MMLTQAGRGAALAFQFLTRLPTPQVKEVEPGELSRSSVWFPAVGLVVGGLVAVATWFGGLRDPWLGALLGLATWTWVTGALHLDGLGDLMDGLGAAHANPERLLRVMGDPNTGIFAVVAVFIQLATKLIGLRLLAEGTLAWPLTVLAAAARLGPLYWSQTLPPLGTGQGREFAGLVPKSAVRLWACVLCFVTIQAPALLVCVLSILGWRFFLARRIAGQTGDALGAGIEIVESLGLLALVVLGL